MIQVHELRIGNYLTYKNPFMRDFEFVVVDSVLSDGIMEGINYNYESQEYIKLYEINPIPISEEWLVKFGFLKSHNDRGNTFHIMEENGFVVKYTIEHWTKTTGKYYDWYHLTGFPRIQTVHQLQNIFFALTGKELEINN